MPSMYISRTGYMVKNLTLSADVNLLLSLLSV